MPKVVYTSAKGLVTESGAGFTITNGPIGLGFDTVTDAGTPSLDTPLTLLVDSATADTLVLANGTVIGQVKYFLMTAIGTGTEILEPTTTAGGWTRATFAAVGQSCSVTWDGNGWALSSRSSGATATANAVAGLPVLA